LITRGSNSWQRNWQARREDLRHSIERARLKKEQNLEAGKPNRSSFEGEYQALRKYADRNNLGVMSFDEFKKLAKQPCQACGGKTPGYECNTLSYIKPKCGFATDNVYVFCWPCKKLLGENINANLQRCKLIAQHSTEHSFISVSEEAG
jgi:hypothetical protein